MRTNSQAGVCLCVVLIVALGSCHSYAEATGDQSSQLLVVATSSGRRFRGEIDPRTDAKRLWLRSTHGGSSALRPIDWDRINQVELGEECYKGEEFWAFLHAISSVLPSPGPLPERLIRRTEDSKARPGPPQRAPAGVPPVQSLRIEAGLANWDGDVEVDGVWLEVQPLSDYGEIMPVDATLWVDLMGRETGTVNRPEPPIRLGQWSRRVTLADFGLCGAVYHLPFQALHPAFDPAIAPDGLVHVRLSVPGRGVFEASVCLSRLRPYCAFRDHLYHATGKSFLPIERTGR